MATAVATIETTPTDPEANSAVGRFLCFVKGDWESGIPMLAIGNEETLKNLAERELSMPISAGEQVALGDAWWTIGESLNGLSKRNIVMRAQHWYLTALPKLSGLSAARVRKRIGDHDKLDTLPRQLPRGTVVAFNFDKRNVRMQKRMQVVKDLSNQGGDGEIVNPKFVAGVRGTALRFQPGSYVTFSDNALPKGDYCARFYFGLKLTKSREIQSHSLLAPLTMEMRRISYSSTREEQMTGAL